MNNIFELKKCSGTNDKKYILNKIKDDDWARKFLYYSLNPMITYNLSEATITGALDNESKGNPVFGDIFECFEYLSRLRGMDNVTLKDVSSFLRAVKDDKERRLYIEALSKTLRLGVTARTVNKVIPNLIPEWGVQEAYTIEKYPVDEGKEFWLTQKLNGLRATYYKGSLISRTGIPYSGLDHIVEEIKNTLVRDDSIVLDGELTLLDKGDMNDNEAFRTAAGIINSDSMNKTGICYTVFDAIPSIEFDGAVKNATTYKDRRVLMDTMFSLKRGGDGEVNYVSLTPVLYHGRDVSKINDLLDVMVSEDKEGLMLNLNVPYKRLRHRGILKVKRFYTSDLEIVGFEEGSGRLSGTLGCLIVDYNGNEVKVGSGFTDDERRLIWEHRNEIIGRVCEVKYKEVSKNKSTLKDSLQFPIFVGIREDKETQNVE